MPIFGGGGGGGNLTLLQEINMDSAGAANFDFTSITAYDAYYLVCQFIPTTNTGEDVLMRFNADSGANYTGEHQFDTDTTVAAAKDNGLTYARVASTGAGSAVMQFAELLIGNRLAAQWKGYHIRSTSGNTFADNFFSGVWKNTSAKISEINIYTNTGGGFNQYSDVKLYGVK